MDRLRAEEASASTVLQEPSRIRSISGAQQLSCGHQQRAGEKEFHIQAELEQLGKIRDDDVRG